MRVGLHADINLAPALMTTVMRWYFGANPPSACSGLLPSSQPLRYAFSTACPASLAVCMSRGGVSMFTRTCPRAVFTALIFLFLFTASTVAFAQAPVAGQVLIGEFRQRGPGGGFDEFVELYNNTDAALVVNDPTPPATGAAGWAVASKEGVLLTSSILRLFALWQANNSFNPTPRQHLFHTCVDKRVLPVSYRLRKIHDPSHFVFELSGSLKSRPKWVRPTRFATIATSSASSTGFATCIW